MADAPPPAPLAGLKASWLLWQGAWRGLPDNPVATLLLQAARRRRGSIPLWRRYLPLELTLAALLVLGGIYYYQHVKRWLSYGTATPSRPAELIPALLIGVIGIAMLVWILVAERRRESPPDRQRVLTVILAVIMITVALAATYGSYIGAIPRLNIPRLFVPLVYGLLTIASIGYLLLGLERTFSTVADAMRVLSLSKRPSHQLVLDDLLAVTALSDREIVVGVLRVIAPRLWIVSIAGGFLLWLWLLLAVTEGPGGRAGGKIVQMCATAPLTIGAVAFSGILGSIIIVLWLICHGRGRMGRFSGMISGALMALGSLIFVGNSLLMVAIISATMAWDGADVLDGGLSYYARLAVTTAVVGGGYFLFLGRPARSARGSALAACLVPLLYPIGLAAEPVVLSLTGHFIRGTPLWMVAYHQSWGSAMVFNPVALPSSLCLGVSAHKWIQAGVFLEVGYVILIVQQLVMIAIGLHHARLAVMRRRQDFV